MRSCCPSLSTSTAASCSTGRPSSVVHVISGVGHPSVSQANTNDWFSITEKSPPELRIVGGTEIHLFPQYLIADNNQIVIYNTIYLKPGPETGNGRKVHRKGFTN